VAVSAGPLPRFGRSPHLVDLIAEAERLAASLHGASAEDRAALRASTGARARAATLALDGASIDGLPDLEEAARIVAEAGEVPLPEPARRGTWLDALRLGDDPPDRALQALEVLGVAAADDSDDLADRLLVETEAALGELHRRLTRGLVAPDRAGRPRTSEQAVHDASTGRIIYFAADPAVLPGQLGLLGAWASSVGAREHGIVASGVLHLEVLRLHPFDAANGRLARAAARLVLRSRGLDPDRLAAPEPALAADPLGTAEEVARTARRRDLTIWLERWGEAVTDGLRDAARSLGLLDTEVPDRAREVLADRTTLTVADYRADAGLGPEDARAELTALLDAGLLTRVPGTRGLRFQVRHEDVGTA
jgi:fido (protein-threonine AMPylation protein)